MEQVDPYCEETKKIGMRVPAVFKSKTTPFYQWMGMQQPLYPIEKYWDLLSCGEPPVWDFNDMSFPEPILRKFTATGILPLTPIQLYALRLALSASHMVATFFTGPGKTLVLALSLIMVALRRLSTISISSSDDEGQAQAPYCLLVCESNENAVETYRVVEQLIVALKEYEYDGYPELRSLLCVDNVNLQMEILKKGLHIVVSTPHRLKFTLAHKLINLANCSYLALDEAEILFESRDDIKHILGYFEGGCQTVVFSAHRTKEVDRFVEEALKHYTTVRATTDVARLNVIQHVEYVKQEEKVFHIIDSLKRTICPVLVICGHMNDVDYIHAYLTEKGYKAAAVHADKDPKERAAAISSFKLLKHHVMVATDAALDELDFDEIRHVINYDMPSQIDKYIRIIARAGRRALPGLAITYINENQPVELLVQLKILLQETKHRISPVLVDLIHGIQPWHTY